MTDGNGMDDKVTWKASDGLVHIIEDGTTHTIRVENISAVRAGPHSVLIWLAGAGLHSASFSFFDGAGPEAVPPPGLAEFLVGLMRTS